MCAFPTTRSSLAGGVDPATIRDNFKFVDLMSLRAGTRLGAYEIQFPLGAGGMGEVYEATDTRLDRTVAIRVLPGHVASDPDLKRRFEREARTLAALSHPHICPVFDVGSQDGIEVGGG